MAAGVWSWLTSRVYGVAMRPFGVQSRAVTLKGSFIVAPLPLAITLISTFMVPSCARSEPKRAI
jgi:hypothetical protein